LLRQVVTDNYFNTVISASDTERLMRARDTSWALCYFLCKTRLPGLMRYYQEMSAQPRDLEVDGKTSLAAFARCFDVANATADDVDPAKFEQLAKDWVAYFKSVQTPGADFGLEVPDSPTGGNPGGRGNPGGGQPPPGGRGLPPGGAPPGGRGGGRGGRGGGE